MITLSEPVEKQVLNMAHEKNTTPEMILEWAIESLFYDFKEAKEVEDAVTDIENGKSKLLTLDEFKQAMAHDMAG
jgi:hypothetical protein